MSLVRPRGMGGANSFPRVSGDEPRWFVGTTGETPFSPRERG